MTLLEKELEDFIFNDIVENGGRDLDLRGLGLSFVNLGIRPKVFRQLNLGPYGILDVACIYRFCGSVFIDLLELKAVPIKIEDFEQVCRYASGLKLYFNNTFKGSFDIIINKHLVGFGYDSGQYIQNHCSVTVTTYEYDLGGISFKTSKPYCGWYELSAKGNSFRKVIEKQKR